MEWGHCLKLGDFTSIFLNNVKKGDLHLTRSPVSQGTDQWLSTIRLSYHGNPHEI